VKFHHLRHTAISHMAESRVPMPVLGSLVGHLTQAMTDHYTHIGSDALRKAVEKLGSAHPKIQPNPVPFVDKFVDEVSQQENDVSKLLQ
jgi:site-specific recombinase XerC